MGPGQAIRLFPDLISAGYSFRPRRWWKRAPYLPIPDSTYTRWRLYTAYGRKTALPSVNDIAAFSVWREELRRFREMERQ